jgi:putative hydrolase of the HAD superfamily
VQYYPIGVPGPVGTRTWAHDVTAPGHNGPVADAVIFDFYGTLAHWVDARASSYATVFTSFGYEVPSSVFDGYFTRYDGIDHAEHSVDEDTYEAWVRTRLRDLAASCGVRPPEAEQVVEALCELDQGEMVAYPEVAAVLESLRAAGLAVGVCSNWGWELDGYLSQVGLLHLVDSGITSARVGSRKPHPAIYARSADSLGVDPARAVFVGDSWEPDVRGPRRIGMTAVHVWREDERAGQLAPPLEPGDHRISELIGVLPIVGLG